MKTSTKKCPKCGITKDKLNFNKHKNRYDFLQSVCKECNKNHRSLHKKTASFNNKVYRDKNKEKISIKNKEYVEINKKEITLYRKNYFHENKERDYLKRKEYTKVNKNKITTYQKDYYNENKKRIIENGKIYSRKYRKTPTGKLISFCRSSLSRILDIIKQNKNFSLSSNMPYTIKDLKKHLESKFDIFMTWDNYGLWHIDHKIPIIHLIKIYKDKPQKELLNIVNSLDNLQPMWAIDNLKKGAKVLP